MAYIITEPCLGTCDTACVAVCPVDCIYPPSDEFSLESDDDKATMREKGEMLYIHPEECIDCGACEPECPVDAIFSEDDVPEEWNSFIAKNYEKFGLEAP